MHKTLGGIRFSVGERAAGWLWRSGGGFAPKSRLSQSFKCLATRKRRATGSGSDPLRRSHSRLAVSLRSDCRLMVEGETNLPGRALLFR